MTLTKAQRRALEYVRETQAGYHWGMWDLDIAGIKTWNKLERMDLIDIAYGLARLTDAGREALATVATHEQTLLDALHDGTFGKLLDAAQKEGADDGSTTE